MGSHSSSDAKSLDTPTMFFCQRINFNDEHLLAFFDYDTIGNSFFRLYNHLAKRKTARFDNDFGSYPNSVSQHENPTTGTNNDFSFFSSTYCMHSVVFYEIPTTCLSFYTFAYWYGMLFPAYSSLSGNTGRRLGSTGGMNRISARFAWTWLAFMDGFRPG